MITDNERSDYIRSKIRTVPDFPQKGIMFRDITTAMKDPTAMGYMIALLFDRYKDEDIDYIVGIESRGFIFGAALADRLGCGFVPVRKKGKLPADTICLKYDLEYGSDEIEIHKDAIEEGSNVIIIDDLIATGGSALAACNLLDLRCANILECAFVIDLVEVGGSERLAESGYNVFTLVEFDGE